MAPTSPDKACEHQYGRTQVRLELEELRERLEPGACKISKAPEPVMKEGEKSTKHVVEDLRPSLFPPPIYPLRTIGKIWAGANGVDTYTSTGVLVGRNLLLTASHTVPWNKDGWWMRFVPSWSPPDLGVIQEPYGASYVSDARGWAASGTAASDMAICKLYTPLGAQDPSWTGCLSFSGDSGYINGNDSVVAGYDPVTTPDVLIGVVATVTGVQDANQFKLLESVEFPVRGWEGGVIYTWWNGGIWITGVLTGMLVVEMPGPIREGRSGWAAGPGLVDLVNWAWENWS